MDELTKTKFKSFWEKPEGKTGMLALAAIIGGGIIGFTKILPWLIMVASNTLHLMFLLGAIGVVLFLITNPQVRTLVKVAFQLAMKKLTGFVVQTDPIAILGLKVKEMEDNLERVGESLTKLKQTKVSLEREINQNAGTIENSMRLAAQAKAKAENSRSQDDQNNVYLNTRKAGRLEKSNMTLKQLFTKIETMHRILTKIYNNSAVVIADTKDEIHVSAKEWESVKAATSAMKSAMNLLNGNPDTRAIYEAAYETLADDIANKSGELEQMLEMSESFMSNIDLQNGVFQEDGLKMLDAWEKKADGWLASSAMKNDAVSKATGVPLKQFTPETEEVIENTNNSFQNLFNK